MCVQQRYAPKTTGAKNEGSTVFVKVDLRIERAEPGDYGSSGIEALRNALVHYREFLLDLPVNEANFVELAQVKEIERNLFTAVRDRLSDLTNAA